MKKQRLNQTWRFWKCGEEKNARLVYLPHDAMLWEKRSPDCPNGTATGFLPGGKYIYETELTAEPAWQGQRVLLEFEGVYMNASVYLNGEIVLRHAVKSTENVKNTAFSCLKTWILRKILIFWT